MKKKGLINEEDLKRFKLLSEYDFYIGEDDYTSSDLITEEPPEEEDDAELDLGDVEGGDAGQEGGEDLGADDADAGDEEGGEEIPTDDLPDDAEFDDGGDEEMDLDEPSEEPLPEPEPMEDEVELDVTQLVQGTEAAKASADQANAQISNLMSKFEELSASLERMSSISSKIDDLEQEVEKRNPLPQEKLEMVSLSSYPYNLRLTDYWQQKDGHYDAMGGEDHKVRKEPQEYVLTQDDIDDDYNSLQIKDTFDDSSEYEELDDNIRY